jgi:hypothetical protein
MVVELGKVNLGLGQVTIAMALHGASECIDLPHHVKWGNTLQDYWQAVAY